MFFARAYEFFLRARSFIVAAFVVVVAAFFGVGSTHAAIGVNHQMNYQAKLLDVSGQPVVDGTYQIRFSLYNASSGGITLWTASGTVSVPTPIPVTVTNGLFTVLLGDTSASGGWQNPLTNIDWNLDELYLGVRVASDSEMTPRKRIGAVPQAFNAEQLQGMYASSSNTTIGAMFVINQGDGTAAGATRTALEIRNQGTSAANDFSIRALNSGGSAVYTLNNAGNATGTSYSLIKNGKFKSVIDSNISLALSTTTNVGTFGGVNEFKVHGRYGYVLSNTRYLDIVDLGGLGGSGSIGRLSSTYMNRLEVGGNYAYGGGSALIYVMDVSKPTNPRLLSSWDFSGSENITFLSLQGNRLYVGYTTRMKIIDVSNPNQLRLLGTFSSVTKVSGGVIQGKYAYLTDRDADVVRVVDITDPENIVQVSSYSIADPMVISAEGTRLAVIRFVTGSSYALTIIDATNPAAMTELGTHTYGRVVIVPPTIRGRYVYTSAYNTVSSDYEVYIVDTADPSSLSSVQSFVPSGGGGAVAVAGNEFFVPTGSGINVYTLTTAEMTAVKAHSLEAGGLDVRSESVFGGTSTFLRGVSVLGGIDTDTFNATASSTIPITQFVNTLATTTSAGWGSYINSLLVGGSASATGTANYRMVLTYNPTQTQGFCLDNLTTAKTCPISGGGAIIAEDSITGGGYDLAEKYQTSGDVAPGDLLVFDSSSSSHVTRSSGIPYDARLMGIASTAPGFILGFDQGTAVALAGRVPTRFSPVNGSVAIGDPLTSSMYPGVSMKATKPGRVIGYALEASNTSSTIEVFVQPGYEAGTLLANNGQEATLNGDLVVMPQEQVDAAMPTSRSWGLTFRGAAWDGSRAITHEYLLSTDVASATSSQWSIRQGTSTLFAVDQAGNARIQGDLFLGSKLFLSARGSMQTNKYLFLDDREPAGSYIATNADGWQANDSYDFAERYYSPDALTPGDLVVVSREGRFHVQRSFTTTVIPMGIVSTRPAFVAGAPATSTYPIALAGRVPTKVTAMNGTISIGDLLAPSSIPGVAMKATQAGPVVGQALEAFQGESVGLVEVFVHAGWWGGPTVKETIKSEEARVEAEKTDTSKVYQGLARVTVKGLKVHVQFPSVGSYPLVQVTPRGEVDGGWWTDNYTHDGFDILLKKAQTHELTFAWRVEGMTPEESKIPLSDGTIEEIDLSSGNLIPREPEPEEEPVLTAPAPPEQVVIVTPASSDVQGSTTTDPASSLVSPEPVVPATTIEPSSIAVTQEGVVSPSETPTVSESPSGAESVTTTSASP